MFVIGILPALVTVWIRTSIHELRSGKTPTRRGARPAPRKTSAPTSPPRTRPEPLHRRRPVRRTGNAAAHHHRVSDVADHDAGVVGHLLLGAALCRLDRRQGRAPGPQWASYAGMAYNLGAILGYVSLGFLADRFGRKPIAMMYFAVAFVLTPVLFLWTHDPTLLLVAAGVNAFFTLGQYSWMAVWLPELFPTRSRATGLAFTFNAPRFIAFLRAVVRRRADRAVRRLQPRCDDDRPHLHLGLRRRAAVAGDQRQTAAAMKGVAGAGVAPAFATSHAEAKIRAAIAGRSCLWRNVRHGRALRRAGRSDRRLPAARATGRS